MANPSTIHKPPPFRFFPAQIISFRQKRANPTAMALLFFDPKKAHFVSFRGISFYSAFAQLVFQIGKNAGTFVNCVVFANFWRDRTMATGKKPASKAGKELQSKKSTKDEKTVAASDLAQAKKKPPKKR
jgi:hypothetical protein